MDNVAATILLGATGGINGGLLAASAIEKLQLAAMPDTVVVIAVAGIVGGTALVAAFRSMVAMLGESAAVHLI